MAFMKMFLKLIHCLKTQGVDVKNTKLEMSERHPGMFIFFQTQPLCSHVRGIPPPAYLFESSHHLALGKKQKKTVHVHALVCVECI